MRKTLVVLLFFISGKSIGQTIVTLDSVLVAAIRNHPAMLQAQSEIMQQHQLKKNSFNLPNPQVGIETPAKEFGWSVSQSIEFPLVYVSQAKLSNQNILLSEKQLTLTKSELTGVVRNAYVELQFSLARYWELKLQDSLYHTLSNANDARYNAGEIGLLEKINANNSYLNKHNEWYKSENDLENAQQQLLLLSGLKIINPVPSDSLMKRSAPLNLIADTSYYVSSPFIDYAKQNSAVSLQNWKLEKAKLLPGFFGTYLNDNGRSNSITPTRFDLGISIPLWFWSYSGRIKAAKYQLQAANDGIAKTQLSISSQWQQAITDFKKSNSSLHYFESSAMPQAKTIIDASTRSYKSGEIGYVELLQNLNTAFDTRLNYFSALKDYNNSIIQIQKISGQ